MSFSTDLKDISDANCKLPVVSPAVVTMQNNSGKADTLRLSLQLSEQLDDMIYKEEYQIHNT